jgi:ABC-type uncharacterized transport system fused permease/ATPase subunit
MLSSGGMTIVLGLRWTGKVTSYPGICFQVFNMSGKTIDADQRLTLDVDKLTTDLAGLVTGMVKPVVDILW